MIIVSYTPGPGHNFSKVNLSIDSTPNISVYSVFLTGNSGLLIPGATQ